MLTGVSSVVFSPSRQSKFWFSRRFPKAPPKLVEQEEITRKGKAKMSPSHRFDQLICHVTCLNCSVCINKRRNQNNMRRVFTRHQSCTLITMKSSLQPLECFSSCWMAFLCSQIHMQISFFRFIFPSRRPPTLSIDYENGFPVGRVVGVKFNFENRKG